MNEKTVDIAKYVEVAAKLIDLPLTPEYLPGVVENFSSIAAIATLVTEFNLPEEKEPAPVFKP